MQGLAQFWAGTDDVGRAVALMLLAMSVTAWVLILWKTWLLRRVKGDLGRTIPAFWDAAGLADARLRAAAMDREGVLLPLLDAASAQPPTGSLLAAGTPESRLTRGLRDALQASMDRLRAGQVVLASIGSMAPFVGLLGTVWGVHHALAGMTGSEGLSIERIAGPIGEALVMTAAGIAVAVPAVLGYNVFGRLVDGIEATLEGFAHDLRQAVLEGAGP